MSSYIFQNGDSLDDIAARFGLTATQLAISNGFNDPTAVKDGDVLVLPDQSPAASTRIIDATTGQVLPTENGIPTMTIMGKNVAPQSLLSALLKPPKVYWVIGLAAVAAYFMSQKNRR